MFNEIRNTPTTCQICGAGAYGKETTTPTTGGTIIECVWVCSRCGGVARRHSEFIESPKKEDGTKSPKKNS